MNDTTPTNAPKIPSKPKKPVYTRPRFIVSVIAGIIFLILIVQNSESISIDVFFWKASAPAALLYVVFALIGFIVGWFVRRPKHSSSKES